MEEYYTAGEQKFLLKYETATESPLFYEKYADLYRSCFGNREYVSPEWFNWFNLECPFGKSNIYTVTDCESNQLAGAYTLLSCSARYNGQDRNVFLCCNVMTHPEYGGKGLFTQIGAFALKHAITGNAIALGIPNENAIKGHQKVGWQEMPDLYFVQKNKALFAPSISSAMISDDLSVLASYDFAPFNQHYSFLIKRSFDFIQWRYVKKKTSKYSCCYVEQNGKVSGFAIFKLYEDTAHNQRKIHIVDYCITDQDTFRAILQKIESYAIDLQVDLINTWDLTIEHSAAYHTLQQLQYHISPSFNRFILYSPEKINTSDIANWHIALGDNDVY
jgi:hypothetical protein